MTKIYLAGSLRNDKMTKHRDLLMDEFPEANIFMEWYGAGPHADDHWKDYFQDLGVGYKEALKRPVSMNVFNFDKKHIDDSDIMILAQPAGKSGHLELGYSIGKGKVGIYFFPEEEDIRWDVMVNFATHVAVGYDELVEAVKIEIEKITAPKVPVYGFPEALHLQPAKAPDFYERILRRAK